MFNFGSWWTSLSYINPLNNVHRLTLGLAAQYFALVAVNGNRQKAFIEGRRKKKEGRIGLYILPASLCVVAYCRMEYNRPLNQKSCKIGIVQGNIPNEIKFRGGWGHALEGATTGYKQ